MVIEIRDVAIAWPRLVASVASRFEGYGGHLWRLGCLTEITDSFLFFGIKAKRKGSVYLHCVCERED